MKAAQIRRVCPGGRRCQRDGHVDGMRLCDRDRLCGAAPVLMAQRRCLGPLLHWCGFAGVSLCDQQDGRHDGHPGGTEGVAREHVGQPVGAELDAGGADDEYDQGGRRASRAGKPWSWPAHGTRVPRRCRSAAAPHSCASQTSRPADSRASITAVRNSSEWVSGSSGIEGVTCDPRNLRLQHVCGAASGCSTCVK